MLPVETAVPRRADARRNRERVLAAAEAVFAESGLKAPVEEVARRAGVGVGTVCRNFPTKQALIEAVVGAMYETLLHDAEEALADPDPAHAFERFVTGLPAFQARHRALADQMANDRQESAPGPRDQLLRAVSELVARAQAAGAIRADIGPGDVSMLFSGVAHATAVAGDLQPVLRERFVRIILDGLRADDATALPGRPLDFAQLRRMRQRRAK
ncbi:MAG TPA: TetR/AcrR family transcriptional regulator [Acidimicrobiia bacterium]|jgi:AcrR family transcriptional regulator|nr:TetR/AcrR family transcriptional regulator [Acidimicrobiia bacterium]